MVKIPVFVTIAIIVYFFIIISKYSFADCNDLYTRQEKKLCMWGNLKDNFSFNLISLGLALNLFGFLFASLRDREDFYEKFFPKEIIRHAFWFNFIGIIFQIFGLWIA